MVEEFCVQLDSIYTYMSYRTLSVRHPAQALVPLVIPRIIYQKLKKKRKTDRASLLAQSLGRLLYLSYEHRARDAISPPGRWEACSFCCSSARRVTPSSRGGNIYLIFRGRERERQAHTRKSLPAPVPIIPPPPRPRRGGKKR